MEKIFYKIIYISLLVGIILTILSGFFQHQNLFGFKGFGYPFTWLIQIDSLPEYSQFFNINWFNFMFDIIIWAIIFFIILIIWIISSYKFIKILLRSKPFDF